MRSTHFGMLATITLTAISCASRTPRAPTPRTPSARPVAPATPERARITAYIDPGARASSMRPVEQAIATLYAVDGPRIGTVRFVAEGHGGLDVFTTIEQLPPGTHAYHVHIYGDCSAADATSAGPHFSFTRSSLDPSVDHITGNLGELTADPEGHATDHIRLPSASLQGSFSVVGRAVVIHAQPNDPNLPPDGGAGARIACGVIGIANPTMPSGPTARR